MGIELDIEGFFMLPKPEKLSFFRKNPVCRELFGNMKKYMEELWLKKQ